MKKNERNSSLELLRIVAILMVITLHYLHKEIGGVLAIVNKNSINYYIVYFFETISIIAVNLFVIISGYFMVSKEKVKINKVISLLILCYFYGAILYLFSIVLTRSKFDFKNFINSINPFLIGGYWFVRTYCILYLISPFINVIINNINKKSLQKLILIFIMIFSIWSSFLTDAPKDNERIMLFILLYIIGGYIKKYRSSGIETKKMIIIYILSVLLTYIIRLIGGARAWNYEFIFNIISAVSLFMIFLSLKIQSKRINYVATYVFSIYIIHFNPYIVDIVYKRLLKSNQMYNGIYFIIQLMLSVSLIFIVCICLEFVRRNCIKVISRFMEFKVIKDITRIINNIYIDAN